MKVAHVRHTVNLLTLHVNPELSGFLYLPWLHNFTYFLPLETLLDETYIFSYCRTASLIPPPVKPS